MVYSYSLILVIEVLMLTAFITYSLLASKKISPVNLRKRKVMLITSVLLAISVIIFIAPKLNLLYDYSYTKLSVDSWAHLFVTKGWSDTGSLQTTNYPYYSNFPVTYAPQIILHYVTGLSAFDSMTVYYMIAGVAGLFVVYGIGREIIGGSNSEKLIFAGIAGVVYSFLQYINLLFVQQYPLALGSLAALLSVYSFALLINRRRRSIIYLYISAALLSLSHPFAPIFISILFLIYYLLARVGTFSTNPYRDLVSTRVALSMSMIIIVAGATYTVFVASGTFEGGVRWFGLDLKHTWQKLSSQLIDETTSGVGDSFEGRYNEFDTILYPLNWALPTASSLSVLIFFLFRRLNVEEDQARLLMPLSILSVFLFSLSFAFSFVEFAFSRYFGAYALTFNIPVTAYMIYRIVVATRTNTLKTNVLRYAVIGIVCLGIVSSVTDPTNLPKISYGNVVYRDAEIYPTELEIITWNDFFSSLGDDRRVINTNLNGGPAQHLMNAYGYANIILKSPLNYTMTSDNRYFVIDKERLDLSTQLQENSYLDRTYDNSAIYVGR